MKYRSLLDVIVENVERIPSNIAFEFLEDGENSFSNLSFESLYRYATNFSESLQECTKSGDRVLILYPPGLEYIIAFIGCMICGRIPVPAYPPRNNHHLLRVSSIIRNADARIAVTSKAMQKSISEILDEVPDRGRFPLLSFDMTPSTSIDLSVASGVGGNEIAFLQYTSGSTSDSKGVMITQANLLDNIACIEKYYSRTPNAKLLTWMPPYHDMGLIGGLLTPLYMGMTSYIMSPQHFIQSPMRWLRAITRYGINISGGPNFGYEYCVQRAQNADLTGLALKDWHFAFNGAEPVRTSTMTAFSNTFAQYGFSAEAFYPAYGLAESTLFVGSGPVHAERFDSRALAKESAVVIEEDEHASTIVGIGEFPDAQTLEIVHPATGKLCGDGVVGEIWLSGPSVAAGYWNDPVKSRECFQATVEGSPKSFFKTGDLGFKMDERLYVTGRLKDLIIVRGANYYPHDMENALERIHPGVGPEDVIAFSIASDDGESIVLVIEIKTVHAKSASLIINNAVEAINRRFDISVHDIVLIKRGQLPRTSSGKKQRFLAKQLYSEHGFTMLASRASIRGEDSDGYSDPGPENTPVSPRVIEIEEWLISRVSELVAQPKRSIDPTVPFSSLGLDSVKGIQITGELEEWLGRSVAPTLVYEFSTIRALADHLGDTSERPDSKHSNAIKGGATFPTTPVTGSREPIAIVGMACRFPGAENLQQYWENLEKGVDSISQIPIDRWNIDDYYDPDGIDPAGIVSRYGGFIRDIDRFDYRFFGISPREAEQVDPQQRLLLQTVWEALENAGIREDQIDGTDTGVFIGIATNDYIMMQPSAPYDSAYVTMGNAASVAANRISYTLNLKGPSMAIDTACSSSLVAIQTACRSIQSGDASLAIAGGVNLILTPDINVSFSRVEGCLAPNGRCKPFDANADGIVRSEGVGAVILKPLSEAQRDGDRIYAVIQGGAVNQDGRSNGLTTPDLNAQISVLRAAHKDAGIDPSDIDYIEAHGTGTLLGDPIECEAIGRAFSATGADYCRIGSVKSNIGHLEAAAGIAALMKLALSMYHRKIPPSINYTQRNPHIDFDHWKLSVAADLQEWKSAGETLMAGVSGFGFGGTNAHLILRSVPETVSQADAGRSAPYRVLLLSAKSKDGLQARKNQIASYLHDREQIHLDSLCYSLNARRSLLVHREAIVFDDLDTLKLDLADKQTDDDSAQPDERLRGPMASAFVFSGHGSQWKGMGLSLMASVPAFRREIERCADAIRIHAGWDLIDVLEGRCEKEGFEDAIFVIQPSIFAVQVALARLLIGWGIIPGAVIGQSMGEVAAAHISGALTLDDAVAIICERSRLISPTRGKGSTVYVELSKEDVQQFIDRIGEGVSVAAVNGPEATIVSGDPASVEKIKELLKSAGHSVRPLKIDGAAHSPFMDPYLPELRRAIAGIRPQNLTIPFFSTVTEQQCDGAALDADYWVANLRKPVSFYPAIESCIDFGCNTFIEISPRPALTMAINQIAALHESKIAVLPGLNRKNELKSLYELCAKCSVLGCRIAWEHVYPNASLLDDLPAYPWQSTRCWFNYENDFGQTRSQGLNKPRLLGQQLALAPFDATKVWESVLSIARFSYLADHCAEDIPILPAAAYIDMALSVWDELHENAEEGLPVCLKSIEFSKPLFLHSSIKVQSCLKDGKFAVFSGSPDGSFRKSSSETHWKKHAELLIEHRDATSSDTTDIPALQEMLDQVDAGSFYSNAKRRGMVYGPQFQRIRSLWRSDGEALARIGCSDLPKNSRHSVFAGILDTVFQVLGAAIPDQVLVGEAAFLPVSIQAIERLGAIPATETYCRAILEPGYSAVGAEYIKGSLQVLDASGKCVLNIQGLTLKRQTIVMVRDNWFYECRWQESDSANTNTVDISTRKVLLVPALTGDDGEQARHPDAVIDIPALGTNLRDIGYQCEVASDPSGDPARWMREIQQKPDTLITFYICSGEAPARSVPQSEISACLSLHALIQAINDQWPDEPPEVIVVTSNAQPIDGHDTPLLLGATSLWGMVRAITRENPGFLIRCMDVNIAEIAYLGALCHRQLQTDDNERQIAYRNNLRYTARILPAEPIEPGEPRILTQSTYMITGGLSGIGLRAAQWLVDLGARHICLIGRREPDTVACEQIKALERRGATVYIRNVDVTNEHALRLVFNAISNECPPIKGVFHCAGLIDDGFALQLTSAQYVNVMSPKVLGAWNLHRITENYALDYFVIFSSVAALAGSAGQSNYAAGNAFCDMLVHRRRQLCLPGTSINWSVWSEIGAGSTSERSGRLSRHGILGIPTDLGFEVLSSILHCDRTQVAVLPMNLPKWLESYPEVQAMPYFERLVKSVNEGTGASCIDVFAEFLHAEADARQTVVEQYLKKTIGKSLQTNPVDLVNEDQLVTLGMDSITALEIKNRIEFDTGVQLALLDILQDASIATLIEIVYANFTLRLITGGAAKDEQGEAVHDTFEI